MLWHNAASALRHTAVAMLRHNAASALRRTTVAVVWCGVVGLCDAVGGHVSP